MTSPTGRAIRSRSRRTRAARPSRAFTLVELLLVVVIMFLAASLAVPSFVRSYRGAKLRASARTVVMIHRYARGMAVLQQKPIAALYYKEMGKIEIVALATKSLDDRERFLDKQVGQTGVEAVDKQVEKDQGESAEPGAVTAELVRPLPDGVRITAFETKQEGREYKSVYWVNYYPNGMCDDFTVKMEDERKKSVTITADPVSGKAKVKYE